MSRKEKLLYAAVGYVLAVYTMPTLRVVGTILLALAVLILGYILGKYT